MSRRTLHHGNKTAIAGWDRPPQRYFLTIFEEGEVVYTHLVRTDG